MRFREWWKFNECIQSSVLNQKSSHLSSVLETFVLSNVSSLSFPLFFYQNLQLDVCWSFSMSLNSSFHQVKENNFFFFFAEVWVNSLWLSCSLLILISTVSDSEFIYLVFYFNDYLLLRMWVGSLSHMCFIHFLIFLVSSFLALYLMECIS